MNMCRGERLSTAAVPIVLSLSSAKLVTMVSLFNISEFWTAKRLLASCTEEERTLITTLQWVSRTCTFSDSKDSNEGSSFISPIANSSSAPSTSSLMNWCKVLSCLKAKYPSWLSNSSLDEYSVQSHWVTLLKEQTPSWQMLNSFFLNRGHCRSVEPCSSSLLIGTTPEGLSVSEILAYLSLTE